jgi:hypothetical protein
MGGFDETREFASGYEGNITRPSTSDNHCFMRVHYVIENAGQIFAQSGVGRFHLIRICLLLYSFAVRKSRMAPRYRMSSLFNNS